MGTSYSHLSYGERLAIADEGTRSLAGILPDVGSHLTLDCIICQRFVTEQR